MGRTVSPRYVTQHGAVQSERAAEHLGFVDRRRPSAAVRARVADDADLGNEAAERDASSSRGARRNASTTESTPSIAADVPATRSRRTTRRPSIESMSCDVDQRDAEPP